MTVSSPIAEAFASVLRDRGDDIVLAAPSEGCVMAARDVDAEARGLADHLRSHGLARGHMVVSSIGNVAAMPALVLACVREGWPLMPVDRSTPPAELIALAARWEAAVVVVPDSVDLRVDGPSPPPRRIHRGLWAWHAATRPAPGRHAPAALLKLTSGSTGEPRATCTEERHLIADVRHIAEAMAIGPRTRQFGVIPLSHSYGFSNLVMPLLWQGTPVLLRPQFVPTQVGADIEDFRLETFAGVPFMFEHLARHVALPSLPTLRLVVSAGARLPFDTVTAFHGVTGLKVRSFYGSSETGGICFDDSDGLDPRVPVGRPMGASRVTLVPDDDAPAGAGRVQVSGPNVIDGYAGTGTGPTFDGVYLTGDYGQVDEGGVYTLVGRAATFVNVAGRKVHPQEIEVALRTLPGVIDAVAIGVDDALRGQVLGALVASEAAWDARTLREVLATRLAPYKLPRVVVVTRALPLTDRGKIDRARVAQLLADARA